ncbi:NAD(P)/FAD-dependent oxidoreductase [Actinomycetospora termitidis]|uniref:FAD-dependent oxidoreductase n=1 Tax=Actinomycetospora termitidis TaxID=3053470 RepID=A0ABT7M7Q7_9PSEU|nr:FAD-dependent oxidoreductase [Actinomycetospora sp. Odt1-22]MDL5156057.1 FAD-dependent oxidoreductase [Actinomycetospora sp. Odt1-22]
MTAHTAIPVWGAPKRTRPQLPGDRDADVVIVGAGYTGLWAAYYLLEADPSLRVVVLEKHTVGFGASGRNGGWCSAIFPISLAHVAKNSSRRSAILLQEAMNDTVEEFVRVVRAEHIDADVAHEGFLALARTPAQLTRAQGQLDAAARLDLPDQWRVLGQDEAAKLVNADRVLGGAFTPHCATVHPGKLVRGLADVVERMGAVIHEGTEVQHIGPGYVDSPHGRVRAPRSIRATEGYTPTLPGHRRSLAPLYSLVLATEPLPESRLGELGLRHRLGFNDMRNLRIYAQTTEEGRIVFGGRGAPYHFGSKVSPAYDTNPRIHDKIHTTLLDFFPSLADVAITHRWGGPLGVPRDWHPSVGLDRATGHAWAGPYVGDGVATSNLAGRILRNLVLERDEPINDLPIVNHASPRWEPEPFRWLGVNAGLLAASAADREERLTQRPSRISAVLERLTGAH